MGNEKSCNETINMPIESEEPILEQDGWYDDDPEYAESLVFFQIRHKRKIVWQSSWHDVREFNEDGETIKGLRKEVQEACEKYAISRDLSSDDYWDWTN